MNRNDENNDLFALPRCGMERTRTRSHTLFLIACMLLVAVCASCVPVPRVLRHDPNVARSEGQTFVVLAFVERDFGKAYAFLPAEMRELYSKSRFEAEIVKLHPTGYPSSIAGTEFEPVPGQPAMNIFFVGENAAEKFYYRITMVGTVDSGYKIGGFWRGSGPYPPSKMRRALELSPAPGPDSHPDLQVVPTEAAK